jgi:pimeloyl-ACP methyl ester carboxylesterase
MRARIGGGDLEYEVSGSGPAVVLLHAFPLTHRMWDETARALSARNTVVRFDARGFGGSSDAGALLTMERIADDAALLMDHLRIDAAVVGGCSMGGYAAFAFARRHPARLRGLLLVDTRSAADSVEARQNRGALAAKVLAEGSQAAFDAFFPRLVGETTKKNRADVIASIKDAMLAARPRGIADALHGLAARADSTPFLREIRVPTLVVCGDEDVITPPSEARAMADGIAGAALAIIPACGHLPSLEAPEAFAAIVRSFLDRT